MTATDLPNGDTGLGEVLSLTAAMLDSARTQDWVTVANLEATRAVLLHAVFEQSGQHTPARLAGLARQVLDLDRELIALGTQARDAVAGELTQLRQVRRAHAAYSEHESE
ncbi:MAG TPA: flagellar protein FliT [Acidiferrobacterales bacterium]|nr:flagellar protein FliT [Acidiferrobacterales bacterium]